MSAEFALVLAGLLICALQLLPVPIILLLFIAWGSLRVRHMVWRDVGMRRPRWLPTVAIVATLTAVGSRALVVFAIVPILQRLTGRPIDLLQMSELRGNVPGLIIFGLLYRGRWGRSWRRCSFGGTFSTASTTLEASGWLERA